MLFLNELLSIRSLEMLKKENKKAIIVAKPPGHKERMLNL